MSQDEMYIKQCISLSQQARKRGDLPFGSVIVRGSKIIARSADKKITRRDITLHAEIVVLKKAQRLLSEIEIKQCTIYSSVEPCPMCSFIIRELKLKKVVYAIPSPIMGGYTRWDILQDNGLETLVPYFTTPPEVIGGVLEDEAQEIWKDYTVRPKE